MSIVVDIEKKRTSLNGRYSNSWMNRIKLRRNSGDSRIHVMSSEWNGMDSRRCKTNSKESGMKLKMNGMHSRGKWVSS